MDAASDHAPASDGHRSLVDEMGHPSTAQLDLADGAIRDIFSVALVISSARSLSLEPAAARLDVALDDLDGIVRALRRLALTCYPTDSIAPVKDRPDQAMSATAEDALVAQASDALARVDSTLTRLWAMPSLTPPTSCGRPGSPSHRVSCAESRMSHDLWARGRIRRVSPGRAPRGRRRPGDGR
jgi:hypothetical protein